MIIIIPTFHISAYKGEGGGSDANGEDEKHKKNINRQDVDEMYMGILCRIRGNETERT